MKSLELQLKKRLLIVEKQIEVNGQDIDVSESIILGVEKMMKGKAKFICRGSDLTEEIAAGMVHQEEIDGIPTFMQYDCTCNNYFDENLSAIDSFTSAIDAQGWYWGENSFDHVDPENSIYESDLVLFDEDLKRWKDAESRTFHPERTIIFEIVE